MNKLMKHIHSLHIHARINGEGQWSAYLIQILHLLIINIFNLYNKVVIEK